MQLSTQAVRPADTHVHASAGWALCDSNVAQPDLTRLAEATAAVAALVAALEAGVAPPGGPGVGPQVSGQLAVSFRSPSLQYLPKY